MLPFLPGDKVGARHMRLCPGEPIGGRSTLCKRQDGQGQVILPTSGKKKEKTVMARGVDEIQNCVAGEGGGERFGGPTCNRRSGGGDPTGRVEPFHVQYARRRGKVYGEGSATRGVGPIFRSRGRLVRHTEFRPGERALR